MSLKFQPVPDVRLKAVDVDGGLLFKNGATEWSGKGQHKADEEDLGGRGDAGIPGEDAPLFQLVHDDGDGDHTGRGHPYPRKHNHPDALLSSLGGRLTRLFSRLGCQRNTYNKQQL